ncbi:hypothetical protein EUTSA_v10017896mg, partial [Eutrema salsugineum]
GFDPCLVGRRIKSALKKSGYSDPVTITALGDLREEKGPGEDVLRKLSSSGIALNHANGPESMMYRWIRFNSVKRSLTPVMLVFGGFTQQYLLSSILCSRADDEYIFLLAYHQEEPASRWKGFRNIVRKEWLWKSLLSGGLRTMKTIQQGLFFRTSTLKLVILPGIAVYARWLAKALKISPRISRVENMNFIHRSVMRTTPEKFVWGRSKASFDISQVEIFSFLE